MYNQTPIKTGQVLVGALIMGMVSFSAVAMFMGGKLGNSVDPSLGDMLLIVMGILAVVEFCAYHALMRPLMIKSIRSQSLAVDPSTRAAFLGQRFLTLTIVAAAMAEGVGLLGAVTTLLTGRIEALIAPAVATVALLLTLPTDGKLAAFTRKVEDSQPFPPSAR